MPRTEHGEPRLDVRLGARHWSGPPESTLGRPDELPPPDAPDRGAVHHLLFAVSRAMGGLLHARSATHGLTPMQAIVLMRLGDAPLPASEIARHLHCDTSNVTGLVDPLERQGLVERVTPATDRRVRAVALTAIGRRIRTSLLASVEDSPVLDRLDTDELAALRSLLTKMVTAAPAS